MLALVKGEPKILNLKEILHYYIEHRKEVVTRRTKYDLKKAEARLHILEGFRIAIDHIDEIIQIIKKSKDDGNAKANLMEKFNLSEVQAQAILDMKLRSLTGLSRDKIEEEYKNLIELNLPYATSTVKYKISVTHKEELTEIKNTYGDERRTKIMHDASDVIEVEKLIKEEENVVTITHFGYVKRISTDAYKSQRRGGKGVTAIGTREDDFVEHIFVTSTHDYILFFTTKGKVFRLKAYELPEASRQAKGTAIVNLLQLDQDEKVAAVIPVRDFVDNRYVLTATKSGLVKKTSLSEFSNIRKTGIQSITLKDTDEIIDVRITDGAADIILVTNSGMSIRFNESDVRPVGRTAMGVKGIELSPDDYVVGMEPITDENGCILAITENGFGKRTEISEYRSQTRGGKGVITYKTTPKTGEIVGIRIATDDEDVMLITNTGTIIRIKVKEISVLGRATQGVTLMRTNEGKVVSIEKIVEKDEDEV